jgi:hypothetical protein
MQAESVPSWLCSKHIGEVLEFWPIFNWIHKFGAFSLAEILFPIGPLADSRFLLIHCTGKSFLKKTYKVYGFEMKENSENHRYVLLTNWFCS